MRFALSMALLFGAFLNMSTADDHECALNFKAKTIDGETVDLEDYEGKVVLIVNTASRCGLTPVRRPSADVQKVRRERFCRSRFPLQPVWSPGTG